MRWLPIVLGVPAAFLLMAVSMACNWVFFSRLGRTPAEAQMLGGVSIASDIFKALCPFWIIAAIAAHRWLSAFGATVMLGLCLALSFLGSIGQDEHLFRLTGQTQASDSERLKQHFSLTSRESEVLAWISKGKSNRDIGDILGLSARTVNKHLEQIYVKLGVENRASAAVKAAHILHQG